MSYLNQKSQPDSRIKFIAQDYKKNLGVDIVAGDGKEFIVFSNPSGGIQIIPNESPASF